MAFARPFAGLTNYSQADDNIYYLCVREIPHEGIFSILYK